MAALEAGVVEQAFAGALANAWGAAMGGEGRLEAAAAAPAGIGWVVELALSGSARGRLVAWFPREGATQCVRTALSLPEDAPDAEITDMLREIVAQAAGALTDGGDFPDVNFGPASVSTGAVPAGGVSKAISVEGQPACQVTTLAEVFPQAASLAQTSPAALPDLPRLDAVLDVELPLLVRFGQVTMPLQQLADLGPGSVVDMGRSPEEPVELLVGSRVIARGEVVVVSGNYGIRITELTAAAPTLKDLETKAS
jgi:flagellar motor switch protein FliN